MRVCIIGDASEPLDEGMKKTTHALARGIAQYCDVLILNPCKALRPHFWLSLRRYRPEVIHYVPGPTWRSFVVLGLAKAITSAASVMSLTQPDPALPYHFACRLFRPDLLLAQSSETERRFLDLGWDVRHVPHGVDTGRFRAVTPAEKIRLRCAHGISPSAYVILHIGNACPARNLEALVQLQQPGSQVVVVCSTTIVGDTRIKRRLAAAGCLVWEHYVEAVEEVYALADCYVFPTPNGSGAIELPLSVLEAMACNLLVVTRSFKALPRVFQPNDGLYFVNSDDELRSVVEHLRRAGPSPATRAKVAPLDWNTVARKVVGLYQTLTGKL